MISLTPERTELLHSDKPRSLIVGALRRAQTVELPVHESAAA
jgi:hypothetical protein